MNKPNQPGYKESMLLKLMREGTVNVPSLLFPYYKPLGLSDTEAMLVLHIFSFKERENCDFPTLEELQQRLSASPDAVIQSLSRLMKDGFLQIDEDTDEDSGVRVERYNLDPLFRKLIARWLLDHEQPGPTDPSGDDILEKDLFTVFEKEFARPLTPMECETISQWLDQDQYPEELILAALKEAVFAGKVHFRYIDRILLEWSRNRVRTVEQAREYVQKFRGSR